MALKAGQMAPDFTITLHNGQTVNRDSYKGKRLLIYFYPKDNTPGCTAEACSLRDAFDELKAKGIEVLGISADSQKSHTGFIAKHQLPFALGVDDTHEVATAFLAWGERTRCGKTTIGMIRTSYLVDEAGVITHVFEKVDTKNHAQQVLDVLN